MINNATIDNFEIPLYSTSIRRSESFILRQGKLAVGLAINSWFCPSHQSVKLLTTVWNMLHLYKPYEIGFCYKPYCMFNVISDTAFHLKEAVGIL